MQQLGTGSEFFLNLNLNREEETFYESSSLKTSKVQNGENLLLEWLSQGFACNFERKIVNTVARQYRETKMLPGFGCVLWTGG